MPKLFAFDLDGTVLSATQEIHPRTLAAIEALRAAGHLVTVLTGRTEQTSRRFVAQLQVTLPYGTAQGARVAYPDGRLIFEAKLPSQRVLALIERCDALVREFFIATGGPFYVRNPKHSEWSWAYAAGHPVTDYRHYAAEAAEKVVFHLDTAVALDQLLQELQHEQPDLQYYPWGEGHLEITHGAAHKGAALAMLAELLGVAQADTIVFGDGLNDLSMFEWAGHAVAVGVAEPALRLVAKEWVPGPELAGVGQWLERWLAANS
jgi:5-amino-6-(5-phospho-D-ribitylamino)uracil phosphatase